MLYVVEARQECFCRPNDFILNRKPLPRRVINYLWDCCDRLNEVADIQHSICVNVSPTFVLRAGFEDDRFGFGFFQYDKLRTTINPQIWIAGRIAASWEDQKFALKHTLAHEVAHYQQWRDKIKIQERGIEIRARNLLKKAGLD